ncbi:MAG: hypothetical protein WBP56_11175 [Polyangia bacterium]
MADQVYLEKENRFWIDLHKCGTAEAEEIVKCRIEECFTYGVACLEIIYGTPDRDSGSIEEAVRCLVTIDQHVRETEAIHAGMKIYLRENPSAKPRDEEMHFSAFTATYQSRFRQMEFQRDYYPLRRIWSTLEVAGDGNCTREYVRAVAVDLPREWAEPVTEWNPDTGRNETTWCFFRQGRAAVLRRWQEDSAHLEAALEQLGATPEQKSRALARVRTPLKSPSLAPRRATALMCQLKKIET